MSNARIPYYLLDNQQMSAQYFQTKPQENAAKEQ